jgi:hypothetical protein
VSNFWIEIYLQMPPSPRRRGTGRPAGAVPHTGGEEVVLAQLWDGQ